MLYPYESSLALPAWTLQLPRGEFVIAPTPSRPGGPVLFTSTVNVQRFLEYHASRWRVLENAVATPFPGGLEAYVEQWRALYGQKNLGNDHSILFLNPREPFGLGGDFDAEVILLDPQSLPSPSSR